MEEKLIELDPDEYQALINIIKDGYESINFKCFGKDQMITIKIKNNQNNSNNKNNIVAKWIQDIHDFAEQGYMAAGSSETREVFATIQAYCHAVITSVTT